MKKLIILVVAGMMSISGVAFAAGFNGTNGDDVIRGTKNPDTFSLYRGHDAAYGGGGRDVADCGPGHDFFDGGKNPRGKQDIAYNCEDVVRAISR